MILMPKDNDIWGKKRKKKKEKNFKYLILIGGIVRITI